MVKMRLIGPAVAVLASEVAAELALSATISTDLANSATGNASTCCIGLQTALGEKISFPGQPAYIDSLSSYFSLQNAQLRPSCIVSPKSKQDVALTISVLNPRSQLLPDGCNFAIRSGGHTPWPAANNIQDGVTIDLSHLNQVKVAEDRQTVEVGPGNRWLDVYNVLEPQALTVVGGRSAYVGVGGLITGGGISYLSPRFGYAADNVVNFEVVLASGEIVNANSESNVDLWKALKGGSGNFGIVTSFTLRAVEQGPMWGGLIGSDMATAEEQFRFFEDMTASTDYDPYDSFIMNIFWDQPSDTWSIANSVVHTKPQENPKSYEPLLALPQTFNTASVRNLSALAIELAEVAPSGRRQLFVTATFKNSAELLSEINKLAQNNIEPIKNIKDIKYAISFQPIPTIINDKAASTGGNSLGLDADDGNLMNLLLTVTWDNAADDNTVESMAKELFENINNKAKEMGKFHEYVYLNYAAKWQDPISGYGREVKAELRRVSEGYDPTGLFQKGLAGGFKVF